MKKTTGIAALCASLLLLGSTCSLTAAAAGYGQGTRVDELNTPYGALEFNAQFGKYDAYAMSEDYDTILFTFDQGYENGYTAAILDTLKEKQVHAIFFLTGDYAKAEPELVRRMIDEGHMLGNHGMRHAQMSVLSPDALKDEILSLHEYVLDTYGYEMQYLRPPCGEYSEASLQAAQQLGYKTVFWSFAYVDWLVNDQPTEEAAFARLTGAAHGGGIYLLHSVSKTNCAVLGDVIDELRRQGYTL